MRLLPIFVLIPCTLIGSSLAKGYYVINPAITDPRGRSSYRNGYPAIDIQDQTNNEIEHESCSTNSKKRGQVLMKGLGTSHYYTFECEQGDCDIDTTSNHIYCKFPHDTHIQYGTYTYEVNTINNPLRSPPQFGYSLPSVQIKSRTRKKIYKEGCSRRNPELGVVIMIFENRQYEYLVRCDRGTRCQSHEDKIYCGR